VLSRADGAHDMEVARTLFLEYAAWLQVDLCFQGFDAELAGLPGTYAPPDGGLWLARVDGKIAGTIAFRPLAEGVCEMKRLWVEPGWGGHGIGRSLALAVIDAARAIGYARMRLDTLPALMPAAQHLYRGLGFQKIPAYYDCPLDGVVMLELEL